MYLSGRERTHNHHTYSPSFISPSGEYFEMVRSLIDGRPQSARPITLFVHHLQSPSAWRAPIKYFNSLQLVSSPFRTCSYVRDRLIGLDAQICRRSLDFSTLGQMGSYEVFPGTKYDRKHCVASREFFFAAEEV